MLFCDLVGSTQLSAQLDPEDWRDVIAEYQRVVAEAVTRFGGYVARFLGDGVLAYFGFPQAYGDDAERAVRAGLAIVRAVQAMGARTLAAGRLPAPLQSRLGLDTGAVVVADAGGPAEVFGDAPNVAARVQAVALPDSVCITSATQHLVAGLFVVEDLGRLLLKGVTEPVQIYRAIAPSGVRGRLQAAAMRGLPPFVGREAERRVLRECWQRARAGDGQMALIRGEAGIGKSRLVQQFRAELGGERHTWIECNCSPFHGATPFYAVVDMLEQAFGTAGSTDAAVRLASLEQALALAGLDVAEAAPLVAPLLGLSAPELAMPLLPEQQRRKLLGTLVAWVLGAARLQPLIVVLEDLQWVDPSTLQLQELLVEQAAPAPLFLLLTARPEFRAPWPPQTHHTRLDLLRLDKPQTRALVHHVAARAQARMSATDQPTALGASPSAAAAALSAALVETVVERTDGVPLFVEALTEAIVETESPSTDAIPATLHDTLMARLDRLGTAKEVASIASVIGREFPDAQLRAVASLSQDELDDALGMLTASGLVYASGLPPHATYVFKHALVRDAAYACLLKSRRRNLHRAIARALETEFAEVARARPEVVAQHLTQAGEAADAAAAWQRAGDQTKDRGALAEAEQHYRRALELLGGLPDAVERAPQELTLQVALGQVLHATRGYGAPETVATFARARELGTRQGDSDQFLFVLLGLCAGALNRGLIREAQALAHQVLAVAESTHAPSALVWGHVVEGISRYHGGDLRGAREHLAQAMAHYDPAHHGATPTDPGVSALSYGAIAACQLGQADEGRRLCNDALALARRLERPYDLAYAEAFAAFLHAYLRAPEPTLSQVEPLLRLCTEHQFSLWLATGTICRGWALAAQGRCDEGVATIREGLAMNAATGTRLAHAFFLELLAEAQAHAGALAEAAATAETALAATWEEAVYRADVLRLRADVLAARLARAESAAGLAALPGPEPPSTLRDLGAADVAAVYREAIEVAQQQGARTYQLRAATGLARFLAAQGRAAEARSLLAPLHAAFGEGHDTRDVVEAGAVLAALGTCPAAADRAPVECAAQRDHEP